MKHKHAEMIKAKADNMALVALESDQHGKGEWYEIGAGKLPVNHRYSYFLCLPQHKEACLHWLNGEKSQVEYTQASYPYWCDIDSDESSWSKGHVFMDDLLSIRIKPKKEKRWIATFPWCGNVFYVTPESFASEGLLNDHVDMHYGRRELMVAHEIEVEV